VLDEIFSMKYTAGMMLVIVAANATRTIRSFVDFILEQKVQHPG